MSHLLPTLNYGPLDDVAHLLDTKALTESELRAALLNLLRHVQHLERCVAQLSPKETA